MNKQLWFKRRRYGYVWTPVTWQGWLTIAVFLVAVFAAVPFLSSHSDKKDVGALLIFLAYIAVLLVAMVVICIKKAQSRHGAGARDIQIIQAKIFSYRPQRGRRWNY